VPPVVVRTVAPATPAVDPTGEDTLAEVNALRARSGLPPYIYDHNLAVGAVACAKFRAAKLMEGHTPNDFAFLPPGSFAPKGGCGAAADSFGWLSCAVYENATYAGAAWARGADNKRYMSIFVR
jgi:hypothetical protein